MFYSVDKSEDLRLGQSLLDNSGRLLRRGKWDPGYTEVFATEDQVEYQKINVNKKKSRYLKLRNLSLFYIWDYTEPRLIEIILLICISAIWSHYPVILILSFLGVYYQRVTWEEFE